MPKPSFTKLGLWATKDVTTGWALSCGLSPPLLESCNNLPSAKLLREKKATNVFSLAEHISVISFLFSKAEKL